MPSIVVARSLFCDATNMAAERDIGEIGNKNVGERYYGRHDIKNNRSYDCSMLTRFRILLLWEDGLFDYKLKSSCEVSV
jgi:hypothetical protein